MSTNTRPTSHLADGRLPLRGGERHISPPWRGGPQGRGGLEPTEEQTHPAASRHPSEEGRENIPSLEGWPAGSGWVLPRFLRDRRAAGTALTAALFTIMSLAGIAFASDHVWLVYQRDLLKVATDAASVAATKALGALDPSLKKDAVTTVLHPIATRYILANIPAGSRERAADTLAVTIDSNLKTRTVHITATADLGGAIFGSWLWGTGVGETQVKSGTERIASRGGLIEVALALDITGSMVATLGSGTTMTVVKEVAQEIVDILDAGSDSVAVGVVPWHYRVKFDHATKTRWEDNGWALYPTQQVYPNPDNGDRPPESYTLPTTKPGAWKGCVDQRTTTGSNPPGLTAVSPKVTPFNMGFYSPTPNNNYANDKRAKSIAFTCYPDQDYCYDPDENGAMEPQWNCRDTATILPLTTNVETVKNHLGGLEAEGATTYSTLGLIWGHRLLDPTWRDIWGDPVHPIDLSQHEDAQKALVLLTDGKDNFHKDSSHRATACQEAKDDGIKVFVIVALNGQGAVGYDFSFKRSMENCSSNHSNDPGQYFFFYEDVTPEELQDTFRSIGQQLAQFRRVL